MKKLFLIPILLILFLLVSCEKSTVNHRGVLTECLESKCKLDVNELTFVNGKKIQFIDNENDEKKLFLIDGNKYKKIPFQAGGNLNINSVYLGKDGKALIALVTWQYLGSCCTWTEYHVVYADGENLKIVQIPTFPENKREFEEINFTSSDSSVKDIIVITKDESKNRISTSIDLIENKP